MPHHANLRTETASSLVFEGGPADAVVTVDGVEAGHLAGPKTRIAIPDGTHSVSVVWQGRTLYQSTVFIADGTQKIIPLSN